MKPHPLFKDRAIPAAQTLGEFTLRALSIRDLDRDFSAVLESAAEIRAAHPGSTWPEGLTREKNLVDLAWRQREFEARRSFAWVIENLAGAYLRCLYVYSSIAGETSADVVWWWRAGAVVAEGSFRKQLLEWLAGSDWPPLSYKVQDD